MITGALETERPLFLRSYMAKTKAKDKEKEPGSRIEKIRALLKTMEERLETQGKVSMSDFIRLTQLERELEQEEQPGEVIVRWEDLAEKRDSGR